MKFSLNWKCPGNLFLFILGLILLAGCDNQADTPVLTTEYLDIDLEKFPADQYNSITPRKDAPSIIDSGKAVKLTFLGAARMVGGACTLVEYKGKKLLIDAGIFYMKSLIPLDQQIQLDPSELDWVILTHAHGDHNGRLPLLYRRGYTGKIFGTNPTKDICRVMLQLAASIGVPKYRVDFRNQSVHNTNCKKALALRPHEYLDLRRAEVWLDIMNYHSCPLCREKMIKKKTAVGYEVDSWFETVKPEQVFQLDEDISFSFHHAGHILGSSQVKLTLGKGEEAVTLAFTGDIGNKISPVLKPPDQIQDADYLITEATYGSVRKKYREPYFQDFEDALVEAVRRGERVIIPSFVLSKSQKVITIISELLYENKISPNCPVIVTSPTVKNLNKIYDHYLQESPQTYFSDYLCRRQKWRNPFTNPNIFFGSIRSYIKKHGKIPTPAILVVSSGMMDFASALQMAEQYLGNPKTNFFIVGWQSPDSVGRAAMNLTEVVIKGRVIPVLAQVKKFGQFSSHGDLNMLLDNISGFRDLKGLIVHHGETESAINLAYLINQDYGIPVFVPAFLDQLYLDNKSFLKVTHSLSPETKKLRQLDPILELPELSSPKSHTVAQNNLSMAQQALTEGNLALALQYARGASLRYPEMTDAHYLCGSIQTQMGNERPASKSFSRAIELNPYDPRAYLGLAEIQVKNKDLNGAIENLRTCLFYSPENVKALALLGDIYNSLNRKEGLILLKAANRIDPYDAKISAVLEKSSSPLPSQNPYFVASEKGKYFHFPWCETARMIKPGNAVRARERAYFLQSGYKPCPLCNP